MTFENLIKKLIKRLTDDGYESLMKQLSYATSEQEIFSFLRENIFKTDAKTREFINAAKVEEEDRKPIERESLSEPEFSRFLFESIEANLNKKNSKFKIAKHWFSPDEDLCLWLADKNGLTTVYRIISIKAD